MNQITTDANNIIKAELDIQITTAKSYPRDLDKALSNMRRMATIDQETAESCYYVLKRKSKDGKDANICGPSIRMAEIVLSCWGNMHVGKRVIANDGSKITAQAVAWDLETNVKIDTCVDRSIKYANGGTYAPDMQIVTGNAACAIALRNAIFAIIPKAYVDAVYKECRRAAVGELTLIEKKKIAIVDRLVSLGVNKENMLSYMGKQNVSEINEEELADLIGVGTAIKEGLLVAADAFAMNEELKSLSASDRIKMLTNRGEE